jgi:hypothetical protein
MHVSKQIIVACYVLASSFSSLIFFPLQIVSERSTYHASEHGAQTPHVQRVVIFLEIDKQFWALEVARCDSDVVLCAGMVELGQTPIDQTELSSW